MCNHTALIQDILSSKIKVPHQDGLDIGRQRLCEEKLRELTCKMGIEFAVVYSVGPRIVGGRLMMNSGYGRGTYILYRGNQGSVWITVNASHYWISHTHPGGTRFASGDDMKILLNARRLGSLQRRSTIFPQRKKRFHFTDCIALIEP